MRMGTVGLVGGVLLAAGGASGFALYPEDPAPDVSTALAQASRWSSISGLADGLQVAIEPGFAADFGAVSAADVATLEQAVLDAFAMWQSPVLSFDVQFEDATAVEGTGSGQEIDVFAVPGTHPVFFGTTFFGNALTGRFYSASRPLTNGQTAAGWVIDGADLYLNRDLILFVANQFALSPQQRTDALTRLLAHEVGHGLGLGHPNFSLSNRYDDLADNSPTNPIVIDAADPFSGLTTSNVWDQSAIMSNEPCGAGATAPCAASYDNVLHADDAAGRDVLYPAVVPVAPGHVVVRALGYVAVSDPSSAATDTLRRGSDVGFGLGVGLDRGGDVLVSSETSAPPGIWRLDADTGAPALVASGSSLASPGRIDVGPDGTLFAINATGQTGSQIVAVDPVSGAASVLASVPNAFDLAVDPSGTSLYVVAADRVERLTLPGGSASLVAAGGFMSANIGVDVEASGDLVILTVVEATSTNRLVRVSPSGGAQTLLHSSAPDSNYFDVALDGGGGAFIAAEGTSSLVRIELASGATTTVDGLYLPLALHVVRPACSDGLDNDGDGWTDYQTDASGDPGCRYAISYTESPECQDGVDNDVQVGIDFDGGASIFGHPIALPDPQCTQSWQNREQAGCGLGVELAPVLLLLRIRRRSAALRGACASRGRATRGTAR